MTSDLNPTKPTLIIISGPTASGKSGLSIEIAKAFNAEIISADSRQFYKGMDIGTAKVTREEQALVKHHFIDILSVDQEYNAGKFESEVLSFLDHYFKANPIAIMVGGSGLYLNAVKSGFDALPPTPTSVREKWSKVYLEKGIAYLQNELIQKDPGYAQEVDLNNHQRIQRALEAIEVSGGIPFSQLREKNKRKRNFAMLEIQLIPERERLYERINARVDQMVKSGLVDEVKALRPVRHNNSLKTVGYSEIFQYLEGKYSIEEAIAKIKQHTRNYAKRQYTWFRKNPGDIIVKETDNLALIKQLKDSLRV